MARKIATLRNQRIESSKALIKGFKSDSTHVEAVYHVLMPTPKGNVPQIHVGETSYLPVDLNNLQIKGSTNLKIQRILGLLMVIMITSTLLQIVNCT